MAAPTAKDLEDYELLAVHSGDMDLYHPTGHIKTYSSTVTLTMLIEDATAHWIAAHGGE